MVNTAYKGGAAQSIQSSTVPRSGDALSAFDFQNDANNIAISRTGVRLTLGGRQVFEDPVIEVVATNDQFDSLPASVDDSPSGGLSTSAPAQPSSVALTPDDAVTFDTVCDAVPLDARAVVAAGQAYKAGQLSSEQLQQLLSNLKSRWTPLARTSAVASDVQALQTALAARMVSQFETSLFQAVHHEEPIIMGSEWTGGDLFTDYQRACGTDLPR